MKKLMMVMVVCAAGFSTLQSEAFAQGQVKQSYQVEGAYYSNRLNAEFMIQKMSIPGFVFNAARITSIYPGSPLQQLGLKVGDVVTRLDGLPINDYGELDRHYAKTEVRYIRTGTTQVRIGSIYINTGNVINPGVSPGIVAP